MGLLLPNVNGTPVAILSLWAAGKVPALLNFSSGVTTILACARLAGLNPAGVIWMLYVLPTHQGLGAGSALYEAAIGNLKRAGRRKALLEVLAANENAVAFYRARGWVPEGRRTEHIPGFRFTALRMGLALS